MTPSSLVTLTTWMLFGSKWWVQVRWHQYSGSCVLPPRVCGCCDVEAAEQDYISSLPKHIIVNHCNNLNLYIPSLALTLHPSFPQIPSTIHTPSKFLHSYEVLTHFIPSLALQSYIPSQYICSCNALTLCYPFSTLIGPESSFVPCQILFTTPSRFLIIKNLPSTPC